MSTNLFTIHSATIASTIIDQLTTKGLNLNEEAIRLHGDGRLDSMFTAMVQQKPVFSLTTTAIKKALTVCGLAGLALTADQAVFYGQRMSTVGRAGGSSNITMTCAGGGLLVPTGIEAQQGQPATITFDLHLVSADGVTAPITIATSAALAGSPVTNEGFTLGPVTLNGTALDLVQSWRLDFGIEVMAVTGDGHKYPRTVTTRKRSPSVSFTTKDLEVMNRIAQAGTAQTATDSLFYLRALENGASVYSDASTQHIKFSIDAGRIHWDSKNGQDGQETEIEVKITPAYDGSNDVVAISTGVAIT